MSDNEVGYIVCKSGRRLYRGEDNHGKTYSVKIAVKCPGGTVPHALVHTHPSGNITLSSQDKRAARQHNIPHICVRTTRVKCYRVE